MKKGSGTCIKFLSHASIYVESGEFKLLVDPWLIGSCYWRSWWNYPPVRKETYANIKPDAVYITHFHWDHWHGVSLKKLIEKELEKTASTAHGHLKIEIKNHVFNSREKLSCQIRTNYTLSTPNVTQMWWDS